MRNTVRSTIQLPKSELQLLELLDAINFVWPEEAKQANFVAQNKDKSICLFYNKPEKRRDEHGLSTRHMVHIPPEKSVYVQYLLSNWFRAYTTRAQYKAFREERNKVAAELLTFCRSKLKVAVAFSPDTPRELCFEGTDDDLTEDLLDEQFLYHGLSQDKTSFIFESLNTRKLYHISTSLEKYITRVPRSIKVSENLWALLDKQINYIAFDRYERIYLSSDIIRYDNKQDRWVPLSSAPARFKVLPYKDFLLNATHCGFDIEAVKISLNGTIPQFSLVKRPEGK